MAFYKHNKANTVADNSILGPQWHPTKNVGLDPNKLTNGSGKQATFLCKYGHEYTAVIRRAGKCPVCTGRVATTENCLATSHPEIVKEWDDNLNGTYTPYNLTKHTTTLINLNCMHGHPYQTKVNLWVLGKRCPYCAGKKVYKTESLAVKHPKIAKEWDFARNGKITPNDVLPNSHFMAWWKGKCGHSFRARVSNRTSIIKVGKYTYEGTGCPICAHKP